MAAASVRPELLIGAWSPRNSLELAPGVRLIIVTPENREGLLAALVGMLMG